VWAPRHKKLQSVPILVQKTRNANEIRLQDSVNTNNGWTLNLSDSIYSHSVVITDTLLIPKDSIHINGNGVVLKRDSAYNGPALLFSPSTKYAFIENMEFDDFDIGVFGPSKALKLKNVKFHNCRIPILGAFMVQPDTYATGFLKDSVFRTDTLSK
jgi:PPM family protein phosphatase